MQQFDLVGWHQLKPYLKVWYQCLGEKLCFDFQISVLKMPTLFSPETFVTSRLTTEVLIISVSANIKPPRERERERERERVKVTVPQMR